MNEKVIILQRKIKSFLIIKKLKENKIYKIIKKNNLNKFYFISKIIKNDQIKKIILIQKYFRSKLKNNFIIKKHLIYLTTPLIKKNGDLTEIDINFSDENNFSSDEINKKMKKNDSLISNETKSNKFLNEELNSSFLNNSGFISKIVKKNVKIIKKNNLNQNFFISKKIENFNYEFYYDFINFIDLIIKKNCQEKIFYLLKNKNYNKCFYIKTLKKVLNFHKINNNKNKVSIFINKIFPNLKNSNVNKIISKLNNEQKNSLANTNIFENNFDQDLIKYLNDFSLFDKNLSNEQFITIRLKNSNLTNTNIFSITKFIDNEYENLIEGKYCMKCYQNENICDCLQKNLEIEESFNFNVITNNLENEFEEIIKKNLIKFSYISKIIIKRAKIIKKNDLNRFFFISKNFYLKQINFDFIKLLKLHLIKNSQQFVFYKLKLFKEIDFNNSFFISTLQRILKFCKSNPKKQSKIQTFINNVFPNIKNQTINKLISNLSENQQKQLSNSNIYTSIEPDFIKYLNDFSLFDKNLSNEQFITIRLKNSNLTNTNIFSITKFIDNEYENLIEGKYCMKCYQNENICDCLQKKTEDEEDYTIDLEMNDDDASKCIVNHFEYDSTKVKGILIKRKPKIEENYEDPITNLINKRKYFTTNNSKENEKKKSNFVFKSNFNNNNLENENVIENNFLFNSNNNINLIASNDSINNSLNNNNNIIINNDSIGNSQEFNRNNNIIDLKKLYHSDKNNKKSNQVIIRGDNNSNSSNDKNNLKYFY